MRHCLPRGRLRSKLLCLLGLCAIAFISWNFYNDQLKFAYLAPIGKASIASNLKLPNRHISKSITVIFRQFEDFDNDLADSVQSFLSLFPNIQILIVCNSVPYPPFFFSVSNLTLRNVRILPLEFNLLSNAEDLNPLNYIKTKYVLFSPDSVRISSRHVLQQMLLGLSIHSIVAVPFASSPHLSCQKVDWNFKEWSLKYEHMERDGPCDSVAGKHGILMLTSELKTLPRPFTLPFPESFYIQTNAKKLKVLLQYDHSFSDGRTLFRSQPARQHVLKLQRERRSVFFKEVGIRKVTRQDGGVHWYGCTRETQRCFPPVMGTPSYLLSQRWTPPCCLGHLRKTARHVMGALQHAGVRCWLEGVSLVGAVRRSDILPWSEHVDIGIYKSDISRVSFLSKASNKGGILDPEGYQWEKATQGEFYHVLYSKKNRIHVNILPFQSQNGTMRKDTWFLEYQKEFPDHYLHPMSSIEFAGMQMPCPNNVREFLELKFGVGVIERTQHPKTFYPYP